LSAEPTVITSLHNPAIKRARSLLRRKGRHEERAFLVEGMTAVADAISTGAVPEVIFVRDGESERLWADRHATQAELRLVTAEVLASLTEQPHPQGVIAVIPMASVSDQPRFDIWNEDLVLIADAIADPGNLGTLIRSAAAAGATLVVVTPNSVDPFHPRCVRAAMGAHFLVSILMGGFDEIEDLVAALAMVTVADASGDTSYDEVNWTQPCAIVIGSEATGPTEAISRLATAYVRIPLARNLESLNAGVAGSLLLLEAAQRRRHASVAENLDLEGDAGR
jgi:TrmH family RNA methyltransferase